MSERNGGKSENCCISHKFVEAASKNPHKVAVIQASTLAATIRSESASDSPPVYDGDKCYTFPELSSSIDSLTSRLHRILNDSREAWTDVYMPKVLSLYMSPSVESIISVFSVLRRGEAFLPLDPSWPRERVLSLITSSNVSLVITSERSSNWLVESIVCPVLLFSMDEKWSVENGCSSFVWPCKRESQRKFCYLMYTSGSTGKPKGVCGTEQGLLNRFLWMQELYPVVGDQLFAFKTSVGFIDHLQEFLGAILNSTPVVIPPFTLLKENLISITDFLEVPRDSSFGFGPNIILHGPLVVLGLSKRELANLGRALGPVFDPPPTIAPLPLVWHPRCGSRSVDFGKPLRRLNFDNENIPAALGF